MTHPQEGKLDPEIRRINVLRHWQRLRADEPKLWAMLTKDIRLAHKDLKTQFIQEKKAMNSTKDMVVIAGKQVERLTYKEVPVMTLPQIDQLHGRAEGTAGRNFRQNRDQFVLGEDYFATSDDCRRNSSAIKNRGGKSGENYLLTETGYLMLVKSLRDKRAWEVQRQLVRLYFKVKTAVTSESDLHRHIVENWFNHAAAPDIRREPLPTGNADFSWRQPAAAPVKYLPAENTMVRIFSVPGKGECAIVADINRACGATRRDAMHFHENALAERIVFGVRLDAAMRRQFSLGNGAYRMNLVRVADAAGLCLCKTRTPGAARVGRLLAGYCAGVEQAFVPLSAPNAARQPELPFQN